MTGPAAGAPDLETPLNQHPSQQVDLYVQGVCQGRRGRGGWAAVLYQDGERRILSGNDRSTTGDRMELTAIIQGLEAAPTGRHITIHTGSLHVFNAMTKGEARNANLDLWERVDRRQAQGGLTWWWVRQGRREPGKDIAERVANMEAGLFQTRPRPQPPRPASPQDRKPHGKRAAGTGRGPRAGSRPNRRKR